MNDRDTDAADQIRRVAPEGVDVVVEVAAGSNAELDLAVIRPRGTIAIYGAFRIGEEAGLPVHRLGLDDTAAAHDAVEGAAVGKVLITVSG